MKQIKIDSWIFWTLVICAFSFLYYQISKYYLIKNKTTSELERSITTVIWELNKRDIKLTRKKLIVQFFDQNNTEYRLLRGAVGFTYNGLSQDYILIERTYFKQSTDEVREALLLHEIGHALGLKHVWGFSNISQDGTIFSYCPTSVMHPSDPIDNCFYRFRNYYYSQIVDMLKK